MGQKSRKKKAKSSPRKFLRPKREEAAKRPVEESSEFLAVHIEFEGGITRGKWSIEGPVGLSSVSVFSTDEFLLEKIRSGQYAHSPRVSIHPMFYHLHEADAFEGERFL